MVFHASASVRDVQLPFAVEHVSVHVTVYEPSRDTSLPCEPVPLELVLHGERFAGGVERRGGGELEARRVHDEVTR